MIETVGDLQPGAGLSAADLAGWVEQLAGIDVEAADGERIDRIRELERLKSACAAAQAVLTVAFVGSQTAGLCTKRARDERTRRSVSGQVALARQESPFRGGRHVGLATVLTAEMPNVFAALRSGVISEWRATLVVRETACLSVADRQQVDKELAGKLGGLSDRQVAQAAARVGQRLDPGVYVARARKAVGDRRVSCRPAPDLMTYVTALVPVAWGVSVYAALVKYAAAATAVGDPRSRGQLMADEFVHRITSPAGVAGVGDIRPTLPADYSTGTRTGRGTGTGSDTAATSTDRVAATGSGAGSGAGTGAVGECSEKTDVGAAAGGSGAGAGVRRTEVSDPGPAATAEVPDAGPASADAGGADLHDAKESGHGSGLGPDSDLGPSLSPSPSPSPSPSRGAGHGSVPDLDRDPDLDLGPDLDPDPWSDSASSVGVIPPGVGVDIQLVMSDRTLFDGDNEPAFLTGYGPIPAALARRLVREASPAIKSWIRRLYTDPGTGQLIDADSHRRLFSPAARQFLIARDQTCRGPFCDAPIRHADHVVPHEQGGPTRTRNGQGLCERCNHTKEQPGWHSEVDEHGITITTPTGHTTRSVAPIPPRSTPWVEDRPVEYWPTHHRSIERSPQSRPPDTDIAVTSTVERRLLKLLRSA